MTKTIKCKIKVLDLPILDVDDNDLLHNVINDIIIALLSYVADSERRRILERQRSGIDIVLRTGVTKTGRPYGRPVIQKPNDFEMIVEKVKNKEITAREARAILGLKTSTYYKMLKKYTK